MSKIKKLVPIEEPNTFPADHAEASIEHEVLSTLRCAAENMGYNRMEFLGWLEDLADIVFDDMQEDSIDYDNLPFQERDMDDILDWLSQRPKGCKVLSVKSYEALGEVVITVKQEEGEDDE